MDASPRIAGSECWERLRLKLLVYSLAGGLCKTRLNCASVCEKKARVSAEATTYFARNNSTGALMLCWTLVAVVPRKTSARKR